MFLAEARSPARSADRPPASPPARSAAPSMPPPFSPAYLRLVACCKAVQVVGRRRAGVVVRGRLRVLLLAQIHLHTEHS
jgi:hypothetical protein